MVLELGDVASNFITSVIYSDLLCFFDLVNEGFCLVAGEFDSPFFRVVE